MTMKTTRTTSRSLAITTLLAPISWGTTYVTVTQFLPAGRPLLVAAFRVLPAGVVLLALGLVTGPRWRPRGAAWSGTALLAMCNFGLFFPLLIGAVYRLPGGVAAAVGGIQPLLVLVFSWVINGRRPRSTELLVGAIAIVGVSMVVIRPGAHLDSLGIVLAVAANVSFALGVVLTKRQPSPPNRLAATGWQMVVAGAVLLPVAIIVEGSLPALTSRNVGGFAYLSGATTALAFVLWFRGVRNLPAAAPPLLGLAAPVTGALLGWVVLGQKLSPVQLAGFAITIAAIARGASLTERAVTPATAAMANTQMCQRVGSRMIERTDAGHDRGQVIPPCATKGESVQMRALDPSDIDNVAALYDRMSSRSRYLRFMTPMSKISTTTIRHLASVDHERHEAVGVFDDAGVLVGSAHYFKSLDDPTHAEIAVEVDDAHQRLGLGACLLAALARLARRSGVTHFTATVLAENEAVLALLKQSGWPRRSHFDGPELVMTLTLPPRRGTPVAVGASI
jgi:probable blue pigment (indigoidine) exporter